MEQEDLSINKTLISLFDLIAASNKGQNIISSPLSVYACLAMVAEGASGKSLQELQKAFGFGPENSILNGHAASVLEKLHNGSNKDVIIKITNSLYTSLQIPVKDTYAAQLQKVHHAFAKSVDFGNPQTVVEINQRITEATNGLLKNTIDKLDSLVVCVLVNTVYFKGLWDNKFDVANTAPGPFHKADGSVVTVDFMHANDYRVAMAHTDKYSYLAIPYVGDKYRFVIEMANDSKLEAPNTERVLLMGRTPTNKTKVHIPKFKADFKIDLIPILKKFGISQIFNISKDFPKITDNEVGVSTVIHQAFIQVDEAGTEAAAATVVAMRLLGLTMDPEFRADKPFNYHILDKENNVILFSGCVEEPRF